MFGEPISLTFNGEEKFRTKGGGCLSIITVIVFLIFLVTVASQQNPLDKFASGLVGSRVITNQEVIGSMRKNDIGFATEIELDKLGDTLQLGIEFSAKDSRSAFRLDAYCEKISTDYRFEVKTMDVGRRGIVVNKTETQNVTMTKNAYGLNVAYLNLTNLTIQGGQDSIVPGKRKYL